MEFVIRKKPDYAGRIYIKNYNMTMEFYTKEQIRNIYPNKNYRIVGEIGNKTGIQCGVAEDWDGQPLPIYKEKTRNRLTESVVGYAAVDDNIFLCVVKNVLISRILLLILLVILSGGIAIGLYYHIWFGFR